MISCLSVNILSWEKNKLFCRHVDGHGDMWFKLLILWDVNFIILSNTMCPLKWIPLGNSFCMGILSFHNYGPFWVNKFYTKLHKKNKCGKRFLLNLFIINYCMLNITIKLMTNCASHVLFTLQHSSQCVIFISRH